jgi:uridine kinase
MIIGICGPSGSGKNILFKKVKKKLEGIHSNKNIIIVPMDNFYKGIFKLNFSKLDREQKSDLNLKIIRVRYSSQILLFLF